MEIIARKNIIAYWFTWHFYEVPLFLFSVWKNYLEFGGYYFSISRLASTLFSPWKKYTWNYPRAFSFKEYFAIFISNLYSRLMGALCRMLLIALAIVAQACILIVGSAIILGWFLLPCMNIFLVFSLLYV